ncbi:MAG: DHH family phosphoesterase [Nanoarchaeota archaeon]
MLTKEQIKEIRTFLDKSENPLFFFDDDPDGLAAALTLKKTINRGHIIPLKVSYTDENIYLKKIEQYNPDTVFILDRASVPQNVFDNIKVPVIWIDHHEPVERFNVHYYNPMVLDKTDNRCTSFWAYQVAEENMWVAMVGIIGDWYVPPFASKFKYKHLFEKKKTAPAIIFDSEFGKLVRLFTFILKGTTTEVKDCLMALDKVKSPEEILEQKTKEGKLLWKRFEKVNKDYQQLYEKAVEADEFGDPYVFTYPGTKNSYTSILSNELLHRLTDHEVFIIARLKEDEYRISLRSRKEPILPILKKALLQSRGYGGGHPLACGAAIHKDDFTKFINIFKTELRSR